jgi:hypothetical protein
VGDITKYVVDKAPTRVIVTAPPARSASRAAGEAEVDHAADAQRAGARIV